MPDDYYELSPLAVVLSIVGWLLMMGGCAAIAIVAAAVIGGWL